MVHALWVDGRVGLWAEEDSATASPARGRHHPFAVGRLDLDGDTAVSAVRRLRLPTRDRRPEVSPGDGAATRLIHTIGGIDVTQAAETLRPGMRVRAVWKDDKPTGTLEDILHFEPISE